MAVLETLLLRENRNLAFLGRNIPTPLISEILTQVDDKIAEAVCRNGTCGGHVDWTPYLRKFADMKIQVSHFREGFRITPNEGSTISAFYSATCVLRKPILTLRPPFPQPLRPCAPQSLYVFVPSPIRPKPFKVKDIQSLLDNFVPASLSFWSFAAAALWHAQLT